MWLSTHPHGPNLPIVWGNPRRRSSARSTGEARWLQAAVDITEAMIARHGDPSGGFFFVSSEEDAPLMRTKSGLDRAIPSGNGVAARVLLELEDLTGESRYRELAEGTLAAFEGMMHRFGRAAESLLLARSRAAGGGPEQAPLPDGAVCRAEAWPVTATLWAAPTELPAGSSCALRFRLDLADGFHVQSHRVSGELDTPTMVLLGDAFPGELKSMEFPDGEPLALGDRELSVYKDGAEFSGRLEIPASLEPGRHGVPLHLQVQPCDDTSCRRPMTLELTLDLEVIP
mgnify:CR=1 FL=1